MNRRSSIAWWIPIALAACEAERTENRHSFAELSYPILRAGDAIEFSTDVRIAGTFQPLFGADRDAVNPAQPDVEGRYIRFDEPGEYYLRLGDQGPLKVLVLGRGEPYSRSVVRVFDFCVANMLVSTSDDARLSADRRGYIAGWLRSESPAMLLCGPTYVLFAELVKEALGLPVRLVTFPGIYLSGESHGRSIHNVPEVYLPDLEKWVVFDVNNALLVEWLDAFELCRAVRDAAGGSIPLTEEQWRALDWRLHRAPPARRAVDWKVEAEAFDPALVSDTTARDTAHGFSVCLVGGPAYLPGESYGLPDLSPEFGVYFAPLHTDPALTRMAVEWETEFERTTKVCTVDELRGLLRHACARVLAERAWDR